MNFCRNPDFMPISDAPTDLGLLALNTACQCTTEFRERKTSFPSFLLSLFSLCKKKKQKKIDWPLKSKTSSRTYERKLRTITTRRENKGHSLQNHQHPSSLSFFSSLLLADLWPHLWRGWDKWKDWNAHQTSNTRPVKGGVDEQLWLLSGLLALTPTTVRC